MEDSKKWYVVYTRPRWEKKVSKLLDDHGIENYCPLNKIQRQWSDRKKIVLEPLFKGYVFVRVGENEKWSVKSINGIINYLYWLGAPATLKDIEIENIRKFLSEFNDIQVIESKLDVNSNVIINRGVLMNYKGIVLEVLGNKARIQIDSMGIRLSAVFEKSNLTLAQLL